MLPWEVKNVLQRLESAGHRAYAVGGCVRDTLRRVTPHDYDITTSARPEEVLALFEGYAIPTGLQHGTVTVRENRQSFEVTTFRADGTYTEDSYAAYSDAYDAAKAVYEKSNAAEKEITDAGIETETVSPKLLPNYTNQKSI